MKRSCIWLVWCLLIVTVITIVKAQVKSDREKGGLLGPVHTVRTEYKQIIDDDGKLVESPVMLLEETIYNKAGNYEEMRFYGKNHSLRRRTVYTYSPAGKRVGIIVYGVDDVLMRKSEYRYGNSGFLSDQVNYDYDENGKLFRKTVITLGDYGEVSQVADFNPDGTPFKRKPLDKNKLPKPIEAEEQVIERDYEPMDPDDPIIEAGGGRLGRGGEKQEPDSYGNWTKSSSSGSRKYESGRKVITTHITYRSLTYY